MQLDVKRVLVVVAHPDDEVLGCGGTVARLVREGVTCYCAILSEGIMARYQDDEQPPKDKLSELASNSRSAADILGFKQLFQYNYPDNQFDTVPLLEIVKTIEGLIREIQPDTVLTHRWGDLNRDHELVFRAVLTATRPVVGCDVRNLCAFEVPSATEWAFTQFGFFSPTLFIDIRETLEVKLKAMAAYEGESRLFPHPRSSAGLEALARSRGVAVGAEAAEAFEVIRMLA